ncbi:bifunctional folylpolyglutamate synthase/dihydrofolate synthase [Sodalinema gerasimenkoae]|uniref:bifunctional folylpolyglutamate synthase/dihydrofolate synthase n=1 Tax=Sodalinema gerasimenkoae TaxID=2862348 RepID=UPI00135C69B6|nr:folylpolyglutamate synthase/dihydrofolate synthase family protein [Sodalinema gerasimenkoae]
MLDTYLNKFARFGVHLGLERIQRLLSHLGNPQNQVPVIHVAGTNGKGSVCAYLSSILTAAGYRTGRYTSPHLAHWCERICLDGDPIAEARFEALVKQVEAAIVPDEPTPTQFEVVTAAAWLYFAESAVDVAVVEVGLGGRLDATNVCDRPLVSVITSISRDHWQRLGNTLGEIAGEKAGILKANCAAVVGPLPPEAQRVVQGRIEALNCPTVWVDAAIPVEGNRVAVQGFEYELSLGGAIQYVNSAIALAVIRQLQGQGWKISDEAIREGMAKTRWEGRLQWLMYENRRVLVDGAHNVAAAQALRVYVESLQTPVTWVMGMLATKDTEGILGSLLRGGDRLMLLPIPGHQFMPVEELSQQAIALCPDISPEFAEDVDEALNQACLDGDRLPVLCGSLYLIGGFLRGHHRVTEDTEF